MLESLGESSKYVLIKGEFIGFVDNMEPRLIHHVNELTVVISKLDEPSIKGLARTDKVYVYPQDVKWVARSRTT